MKPGTKPQGKVRQTWSTELAYAIGLLVADGCLSKDRRHIDFTSTDADQVETFQRCLGINNKISVKSSGTGNRAYRTQFGDVLFYRFLEKIGLSPAKSLSIQSVDIPDAYFLDFLRGYFDGDGSTTSYHDPLFPKSYRFVMSFTSGSPAYLRWLQTRLNNILGISGYLCHDKERSYMSLKYGKRDTLIIVEQMYRVSTAPRLERKYLKIQKCLGIIASRGCGGTGYTRRSQKPMPERD